MTDAAEQVETPQAKAKRELALVCQSSIVISPAGSYSNDSSAWANAAVFFERSYGHWPNITRKWLPEIAMTDAALAMKVFIGIDPASYDDINIVLGYRDSSGNGKWVFDTSKVKS
jgi:hypothetical protein